MSNPLEDLRRADLKAIAQVGVLNTMKVCLDVSY